MSIALVLAIAFIRYAVDRVAPIDAPRGEYSGARARATLARVLGPQLPHPTGSSEAAAVRARIRAELEALGLSVETVRAHACGRYRTCADVENLVATIPGTGHDGAVLFVAHSDSVPRGPGASDDGAGVAAVLEGARAILASPPLKHDVMLLIDDGEELGLLGAEAFVRDDPLHFLRVRAVVNVEARGVTGPAMMFQTGNGAGFAVDAFARVPRPVGSSLFSTIYERMPNDTDLTVFIGKGLRGLNFAFSDGVGRYHSAEDDLAHQHPGSVQHLGESALAAVRALASRDLEALPRSEQVFFDVFGAVVVRWPSWLSVPLALVLLAVIAWTSRTARGEVLVSAAVFTAITVASIAGAALVTIVAAPRFPWVPHPEPFLLTAIALPVALAFLVRGRDERGPMLVLALLGVVLALSLPGASYLVLAPLAVWAAAFLLPALARTPIAVAASFAVWALVLRVLYPALGLMGLPGLAFGVSLAAAPLWPHVRRAPNLA